jgi:hypothetical protein
MLAILGLASLQKETSVRRASEFLAKLPSAKAEKLVQPFDEERAVWAFTPGPRKGLSLGELTKEEQSAVFGLVKSALSETGFEKVEKIRNLEPVLREIENNRGRDENRYFVTFYGRPGEKGAWAWRWEGHHLSLNFTYRDGRIVSTTPQFLGSNPAEVRSGPQKGTHILRQEEEMGRRLVKMLSSELAKKAILSDRAPADILTSNSRKAAIEGNHGVSYAEMTSAQKVLLTELTGIHAEVQRTDQARERLLKIEKLGWEKVRFAWMGSLEAGQGHYYRIQGPSFVIEYDNTQNGANHIHTVWRDFEGDFGRDALAEHYRGSGHHQLKR